MVRTMIRFLIYRSVLTFSTFNKTNKNTSILQLFISKISNLSSRENSSYSDVVRSNSSNSRKINVIEQPLLYFNIKENYCING